MINNLQRIEELEAEVRAWISAAAQVSVSMSGTDVSTPDKFKSAQLNEICRLLTKIETLEKEIQGRAGESI